MYDQSDVHEDAVMTAFSLAYMQGGVVAGEVFPFVGVTKESDKYFVYGKEKWRIPPNLLRGLSSEYARLAASLSKDTYSCEEYGAEVPIDDRERDNADKPLNPDQEATELATEAVILGYEKRVIDIVTSGTYITQNVTLSGTDQWSDKGNSDPVGNIETGRLAIAKAIGQEPNTLVIGRTVLGQLKEHPAFVEKVKYTQKAVLTADLLASLLDLERVIVASAIYNTAKEGATESIDWLWGKKALLCYVNKNAGVKGMTLGKTFGTKQRVVEQYREDKVTSDIKRVRHIVDEKLVCAAAGYLILDAVA